MSSATSPWWPANEGSNTSLIYPANGSVNNTVVQVPGDPTGIVAGGIANNFLITGGTSNFIFSTEEGKLYGWRGGNAAILTATHAGSVYTGLAIVQTANGPMLYAPDFKNRAIDVYNGQWALQTLAAGAFTDPNLPAGYSPFGVQAIAGRIFVAYAKQADDDPTEEVPGAGLGYVDAYDAAGALLGRVAGGGVLSAPWGLAQAPADFGAFGGDLLVGNFGDGRINAFKEGPANTWTPDGTLKGADGNPLSIQGLWAIQFGKDTNNNGSHTAAYFTAGPFGETQGVFGRIQNALPLDVGASVPAQLALTLGPAASFGAFAAGRRQGLRREHHGERDQHRGRRDAERRRPERHGDRPPRQRHVLAAAGAEGERRQRERHRRHARRRRRLGEPDDAADLQQAGLQRRGDGQLPADDRRQRRAAHGVLHKTLTFTLSTTTP